jgi:hypothetical protein
VKLSGPEGTIIALLFLALWAHATYCALRVAMNSRDGFWRSLRHGTFWPASTLTPAGLRYRRRFYWTVFGGFALYGATWLVLPH